MSRIELPRDEARPDVDSAYRKLYRIGGICVAVLVLITLFHAGIFFVVGLPDTIVAWFHLYNGNPLGGLLASELLLVVYVVFNVPVILALYFALRKAAPSLMSVYLALGMIGAVLFIDSRPAFEMLSLSHAYAVSTTEAQRAMYLAAGEVQLAIFQGTTYWVSYILGSISGLLVSAAILRSQIFSKATAYLRIASSVLDFGLFVPTIGLFISLFSVFCLLGFNVLIARRLIQLGQEVDRRTITT